MKYEELSEETIENLARLYRKTPEYQKGVFKMHKLKAKGFYDRAKEVMDYLTKRERAYIQEYCESRSGNTLTMKDLAKRMDAVDFDRLSRRAHSVVLLADVMDSCIRDMKEISDKYKSQFLIECYEDLFNMGEKLRAYLDFQQNSRTAKVDQLYADVVDSVEQYLDKRSVTLMKNLKKIDDQYLRKVEREHLKQSKLKEKENGSIG